MKEIKDYIHLYIGSQVRWVRSDGNFVTQELTLSDAAWLRDRVDAKLILRPLSSMTEEERIEYFKLRQTDYFVKEYGDVRVEEIKFTAVTGNTFRFHATVTHQGKTSGYVGTEILYKWSSRQLLYLLSKGFDLFGLREAGLAVYEEDLKKKE